MTTRKRSAASFVTFVEAKLLYPINQSGLCISIAATRFPSVLPAIAFLLLKFIAGWTQSSVALRGTGVFATSQKLAAHLVARFSCLKRKVGINTAELERIVATVAGLDGTKTATWRAGARMAWVIAWMRTVSRAATELTTRVRSEIAVEIRVVDLAAETTVFLWNGDLCVLASGTSPSCSIVVGIF